MWVTIYGFLLPQCDSCPQVLACSHSNKTCCFLEKEWNIPQSFLSAPWRIILANPFEKLGILQIWHIPIILDANKMHIKYLEN